MSKKSENTKFRPTVSKAVASHKLTRPGKGKIVSTPDAKATKSASVLTLLAQTNGATLDELMNATSWQAHSVRGFISGTVRKRKALAVISECGADGKRRYRIDAEGGA